MSLFSQLDSAITGAASDAASAITHPLTGAQVRINTNILPSFKLGGLFSSSSGPTPGLLADAGLKYNIDILDANGDVITSIGDPPAFSPLTAATWTLALVGLGWIAVHTLRATRF